jgi:transposase
MGPSLSVEATTTAMIFETYVEKVLILNLQSGQVVVVDNLSAHNKGKSVRELIEGRSCQILLYPPTPRRISILSSKLSRRSRTCLEKPRLGVGKLWLML